MTKRKQSKLSTKILLGLVAAGMTFGMSGTAQAAVTGSGTAEDPTVIIGTSTSETIFHNQIPHVPTYVYGDIKDNTQTYAGSYAVSDAGGVYLQVYVDPVAEKVVTPEVTFVGEISGNSVNTTTFRAEGGAVFSKGANSTFIDTPITNNKAISGDFAHGGAIATHYNGNTKTVNGKTYTYTIPATVTFKVTENKNIAYTGNDISVPEKDYNNFDDYLDVAVAPSGGGFLSVYARDTATFDVAEGGTLTIGNETPATATEDSISSAIVHAAGVADPAIVKTGTGTLTINSNLNRYYGTYTQEAGTVNLNQDLNVDNTYTLQAGTLNMKDVTIDDRYDKLAAENLVGDNVTKSSDGTTLALAIHFDWFNSDYNRTVANSKGSLVTAAGTTANADNITLKDGGSINAAGALNIAGDLSVDASTVTATNATIGGTVTANNASTVTLGGDNLVLNTVNVADAGSKVILRSGTLNAPTLADAITGGGKVTLDGTAVLSTTADQVFTVGDATSSDTNSVLAAATNVVNFKAGALSLTDSEYTVNYLTNAKTALGSVTVDSGTSATKIVMTGTLKSSEGGTDNTVTVAQASAVGSDISMDQVTATATDNVTIDNTTDGFSVGQLEMTGTADEVSVTGKTLTLGGTDAAKSDVITATAGTPTVTLTEGATLNVGNDAVAAAGTALNVGADLSADASTINTNGTTTVTGDVALTNSTLAAKSGILTLTKDLTTTGESTVTGTVTTTGIKTADTTTATAEGTTVNVGGDNVTAAVTTDGIDLTTSDGVGTVAVKSGSTVTVAAAETGTQEIKADLDADGGTVATTGATTVAGDVALTNSTLASNGGTLTLAKDLTTSGTSTVTGNVDVVGAISAEGEDPANLNVGDTATGAAAALTTTKDVDLNGGTLALASGSAVNIGSADTAAAGTALTVTADVTADGSTVATTGDTTVDGNVTLSGSNMATQSGDLTVTKDMTLTGSNMTTQSGDLNITEDLALTDSNLNAQSGDLNVDGNVTLADSNVAPAQSGALNVAGDVLATSGESTITGEVNIDGGLVGGEAGTVLNLGNATTAAKVTAATLGGNGGVISFDPDWTGGGQTDSTEGAIGALDYSYSGGTIRIGNNTTVTIGSTDKTLAEKAFANSGLTWSDQDILSALYIPTTLALTNGTTESRTSAYSLNIGSDSTTDQVLTGGTLQMTKNSLLMVEGSQVSGDNDAAITKVVSTNITSDAKIYVNEAAVGTTYNILSAAPAAVDNEETEDIDETAAAGDVKTGNSAYADAGAKTTQVVANTSFIKFVGAEGNGTDQFSVVAQKQAASEAFDGLIAPDVADAAQDSDTPAGDFLTAVDQSGTTDSAKTGALNSAAALTELAGVQHGLYAADNLFDDSVMGHLTGLHTSDQDKDLWAHYIHSKEDIRGLGLANIGASYDAQFNGVVVGSDFYTKGNATVGAAVTYVNGNIDGNSLAAHTENDADYYGLALYGRVEQGPMTYLGDISYLHGSNDLTQKNSGKTITGSTDSDAYSIGVRAERGFAAGQGTVTPFAGIRYMHLGTDAYTDSLGVRHDSDDANLWLLPLGVRYSADLKNGDWTVRPMAEAGYVWTFGDRDGTDKVGLNGAGDAFGFDIADAGSWYGRLGVEAARGNMTYGVAYQYQHGTSVKSNTFGVKVGYKF